MRDDIGKEFDKGSVIARGAASRRERRPILLTDCELEAIAAGGSKLGGSTEGRR